MYLFLIMFLFYVELKNDSYNFSMYSDKIVYLMWSLFISENYFQAYSAASNCMGNY